MKRIKNWTPLHFASENGFFEIVELLIKYKADLSPKDNFIDDFPIIRLHLVCRRDQR